MEIKKFSKQKNGMYLLRLDDGSQIKIHEDLILKYELLYNKKVDSNLLEKIYQENQIYEIYGIALKYLNIKLRSYKELSCYLVKKGYSMDKIQLALEMLMKQGYLDDKVYADSFVHDKILMSSYGPNRIKSELEDAGIAQEMIDEAISAFTDKIEKDRIEKIIQKQIQTNHNKGSIVLKRKIQSYLLNLGYSPSLINQSLNGRKLVNEDIYQKEYEKLYAKLSKKFSGKELEYKMKQKMYQKGFINEE